MDTARRKALTATGVRNLRVPGKYHDGAGFGLYLVVEAGGARRWVQRIVVQGRRREIGLGGYPLVTLAQARDAAFENRREARAGGDPLQSRRKSAVAVSFAAAARKAHAELAPTWRNPKDGKAFLATLESYLFPKFGDVPVGEVTSGDVRQAILSAREKAPEVARKLVFRTAAVFRWAVAEGLRADNPATAEALALPRASKATVHRKALPYAEVAGCIDAVRASRAFPVTKLALEFLVLTAARSGEVREARWSEFDAASRTWTVPAARMKMGRLHRVPLSGRAMAVLAEARALSDGTELAFASPRGRTLSDMTLSKLVKELGFAADVHGFRTSFRTWAQDCTDVPREICEAALAHLTGDAAERAYARSDVFEKRRELMDRWAAHLGPCGSGAAASA